MLDEETADGGSEKNRRQNDRGAKEQLLNSPTTSIRNAFAAESATKPGSAVLEQNRQD